MKLKELVNQLEGSIYMPPGYNGKNVDSIDIEKVSPLDKAGPNDISFYVNPKMKELFQKTKAGAVLVSKANEDVNCLQIVHKSPKVGMAKISNIFYKLTHSYEGISEIAFIHQKSKVHSSATIYAYAYISEGAEIGEGTVIYPNVYIGKNVTIGANTVLFPNVVVMDGCNIGKDCLIHPGTVIGADGFGFTPTGTENIKVPQTGHVVIEDNVEMGALCTIDRAAFDKTLIGRESKLDSQVHVAHNVEIGELSLLAGQTGIAGSAKIGKNFMCSGQIAVGPGIEIGDNVALGPRTGVIKPITEKGEYMGLPAVKKMDWIKEVRGLQKIPELMKRLRELEKQVQELDSSR